MALAKIGLGDKIYVDIRQYTSDGNGIGFTEDGRTIIVSDVSPEDEIKKVQARIVRVLERTIFAKSIGGGFIPRPSAIAAPTSSPYEIDSDEDEDEDYDEDEDEDEN